MAQRLLLYRGNRFCAYLRPVTGIGDPPVAEPAHRACPPTPSGAASPIGHAGRASTGRERPRMCAIQRGRSQKPPYSVAEGIGEEANPPGSWSASSTARCTFRRRTRAQACCQPCCAPQVVLNLIEVVVLSTKHSLPCLAYTRREANYPKAQYSGGVPRNFPKGGLPGDLPRAHPDIAQRPSHVGGTPPNTAPQ